MKKKQIKTRRHPDTKVSAGFEKHVNAGLTGFDWSHDYNFTVDEKA